MFNKILIANRGEIAVRIIRACKDMGIRTVAVYSKADKEALHVHLADEAYCIGGNRSSESYLNMQNIITVAIMTNSEAIHPGFGFLSENAKFAEMCEICNIKFIGPSPQTIDTMGNKANARKLMMSAKVPVIPGSDGVINNIKEAQAFVNKFKLPVMIKASAGGGGKGIRIIRKIEELAPSFEAAKSEAMNAFSDDDIYMEKLVENARHIEVQILADEHGNVLHLFERDCSLQRRNQKVLEEAPGAILNDETRKKLGELAVRAAKAADYKNAGTIEFLIDEELNIYFMEMNTRIQVEHPITEMITGIDVVKEQIKIAAGLKFKYSQKDIKVSGHAIECRINAEDPFNNFTPSPGRITELHLPSGGLGLRVDSAVYQGIMISPFYDSMIAKVIVHSETREEAILKMRRALSEMVVTGVKTNIDFQLQILENADYIKGDFNTAFIDKKMLMNKI